MSRTPFLAPLLLPLALLALAACETPAPKAAPQAAAKPEAAAEIEEPAEAPEAEEHAARPKTTLANAIAVAQASEKDTHFFGAEYASGNEQQIFRIALIGGGVLHEVNVDAADGKIIGAEEEKLDADAKTLVDGLLKDPLAVGVDRAIAASLEKLPESWVAGAWLTRKGGKTSYAVVLVGAAGAKIALVSAEDGKVLSVEEAREDEEGDEMEESEGKEGTEKPK